MVVRVSACCVLLDISCGLNVSVLPKSHVEMLIANVMVLGGGSLEGA